MTTKLHVTQHFLILTLLMLVPTWVLAQATPPVLPVGETIEDAVLTNNYVNCDNLGGLYRPTYSCYGEWESVWSVESDKLQEIVITFEIDSVSRVELLTQYGNLSQFERIDDHTFKGFIYPVDSTITFTRRDTSIGISPLSGADILTDITVSVGDPISDSINPYVVLEETHPEHWVLGTVPGVFEAPVKIDEPLGLRIIDSDPSNTFGFLETKEALLPLPKGLYKIYLWPASYAGTPEEKGKTLPDIRFRVFSNPLDQQVGTQAISSGDEISYEPMSVYWESDGETPWKVALDLLSFDANRARGVYFFDIRILPVRGN